jgi:hypothetical protein
MSDIKISELPAAAVLSGVELIPLMQAGETRKTTASAVVAAEAAARGAADAELSAALEDKADLVDGKIPAEQLPGIDGNKVKISALPSAGALSGDELIAVVQNGATRKAAVGDTVAGALAQLDGLQAQLDSFSVPVARTAVVDADGDDATGAIGNAARPFRTGHAALQAALREGAAYHLDSARSQIYGQNIIKWNDDYYACFPSGLYTSAEARQWAQIQTQTEIILRLADRILCRRTWHEWYLYDGTNFQALSVTGVLAGRLGADYVYLTEGQYAQPNPTEVRIHAVADWSVVRTITFPETVTVLGSFASDDRTGAAISFKPLLGLIKLYTFDETGIRSVETLDGVDHNFAVNLFVVAQDGIYFMPTSPYPAGSMARLNPDLSITVFPTPGGEQFRVTVSVLGEVYLNTRRLRDDYLIPAAPEVQIRDAVSPYIFDDLDLIITAAPGLQRWGWSVNGEYYEPQAMHLRFGVGAFALDHDADNDRATPFPAKVSISGVTAAQTTVALAGWSALSLQGNKSLTLQLSAVSNLNLSRFLVAGDLTLTGANYLIDCAFAGSITGSAGAVYFFDCFEIILKNDSISAVPAFGYSSLNSRVVAHHPISIHAELSDIELRTEIFGGQYNLSRVGLMWGVAALKTGLYTNSNLWQIGAGSGSTTAHNGQLKTGLCNLSGNLKALFDAQPLIAQQNNISLT